MSSNLSCVLSCGTMPSFGRQQLSTYYAQASSQGASWNQTQQHIPEFCSQMAGVSTLSGHSDHVRTSFLACVCAWERDVGACMQEPWEPHSHSFEQISEPQLPYLYNGTTGPMCRLLVRIKSESSYEKPSVNSVSPQIRADSPHLPRTIQSASFPCS